MKGVSFYGVGGGVGTWSGLRGRVLLGKWEAVPLWGELPNSVCGCLEAGLELLVYTLLWMRELVQ